MAALSMLAASSASIGKASAADLNAKESLEFTLTAMRAALSTNR